MAAHDPSDRSRIASIAALERWSREDPTAQADRARRNIEKRFELQVDPDGTLEPAERVKRAARAKQAHMQRMALKSAQARRKAS
jgi:hypothetical protein